MTSTSPERLVAMDDESPLAAAVALYVIGPVPSGNEMEHVPPVAQVKAVPSIVPEIVSV